MADLLVERGNQCLFAFLLLAGSRREHRGQAVSCLLLPLRYLRGMHCILCGDFVRRFVSLDGFQGYPRLQFRAVSLPLSGQQFSPFDTSLDTAILPYPPVQFSGFIRNFRAKELQPCFVNSKREEKK